MTGQPLQLWPIKVRAIEAGRLTNLVPDEVLISEHERSDVELCLRVSLSCMSEAFGFKALSPGRRASTSTGTAPRARLYELLCNSFMGRSPLKTTRTTGRHTRLANVGIEAVGFGPDEALLPYLVSVTTAIAWSRSTSPSRTNSCSSTSSCRRGRWAAPRTST